MIAGRLGMGWAAALVGLLAAMGARPAVATVVVHNNGFAANNEALPGHPNYASNVSADGANWTATAGVDGWVGAPNIALTWAGAGGDSGTGFDTYTNWDGRGNAVQLQGNGVKTITFAPSSANYGVAINSFDLDAWAGGGGTMAYDWAITGSVSGLLGNGSWSRPNAGTNGGRDTIAANVNGALGETLVLSLTYVSGDINFVAMDNLTFDQLGVIPEPASATLLAAVTLGLCAMRRRVGCRH